MAGVVAVLGHPDRPAAQALLLEPELAVAVRFAQLVQGLEHLDRKLERLGQRLGRLSRAAQPARQDPRGAEPAQVLARLACLAPAQLGQPVALLAGQRHRPGGGVRGGLAVAEEVDAHGGITSRLRRIRSPMPNPAD